MSDGTFVDSAAQMYFNKVTATNGALLICWETRIAEGCYNGS